MYAYGSSLNQKCSNHTLTNLLFGLCRFVWIIDLLVIHLSPHPRALTRLVPSKCCKLGNVSQLLLPLFSFSDSCLSISRNVGVRQLDTTSFVNDIVKRHFSICNLFVVKVIHPFGEHSICCFFAYAQCCCKENLLTRYELLIMTKSFCKKSNYCQLLLMGTSCLKYHPSIWMFTTFPKCKAWTESTMVMLGVSWSQPI